MPTVNHGLRVHVFFDLLRRFRRCRLVFLDRQPVHGACREVEVNFHSKKNRPAMRIVSPIRADTFWRGELSESRDFEFCVGHRWRRVERHGKLCC